MRLGKADVNDSLSSMVFAYAESQFRYRHFISTQTHCSGGKLTLLQLIRSSAELFFGTASRGRETLNHSSALP